MRFRRRIAAVNMASGNTAIGAALCTAAATDPNVIIRLDGASI
jgi:hypothetical protein